MGSSYIYSVQNIYKRLLKRNEVAILHSYIKRQSVFLQLGTVLNFSLV